MNVLAGILSSGFAELLTSIGNIVDKFVTTPEEKAKMQMEMFKATNDLQTRVLESTGQYEQELTKRLQADASSDSWLAKNIRPLALIALLTAYTFMAFGNGAKMFGFEVHIGELYEAGFRSFCEFALAFYFGGRTIEKAFTSVSQAISKGK